MLSLNFLQRSIQFKVMGLWPDSFSICYRFGIHLSNCFPVSHLEIV